MHRMTTVASLSTSPIHCCIRLGRLNIKMCDQQPRLLIYKIKRSHGTTVRIQRKLCNLVFAALPVKGTAVGVVTVEFTVKETETPRNGAHSRSLPAFNVSADT